VSKLPEVRNTRLDVLGGTAAFGPLPTWAEERLQQLPWQELDELSERVLDARTLEDVFRC